MPDWASTEERWEEASMKHFLKTAATGVLLALLLSGGVGAARTDFLIPGGETIGLQVQFGGVCVADLSESNPCAKNAGLQKGDLICKIDDAPVTTAQELSEAVRRSEGRPLRLTVRRGAEEKTFRFAPQLTKDGWRLGLYVRDGINGIGTVTYYDPVTGAFGALGHGIGEGDRLPQLRGGSVFDAQIVSVSRGRAGTPGALQGAAASGQAIGSIRRNTESGVFGTIRLPQKQAIPVARAEEVRTGRASICSCVSGSAPQVYEINILQLDFQDAHDRNFLIEVTDPALLSATGGIVQGMSGSPIIQDGKLVGAVTHVLINQPSRGYGIFIENMLEAAQEQQKAA